MSAKARPERGRPRNPRAQYRLIAEKLRARISKDEWRAGEALPSLRDLAREYGAGVNTLRQAVELLKQEGRVRVSARRRLTVASPRSKGRGIADGIMLLVIGSRVSGMQSGTYNPAMLRGILGGAAEVGIPFLTLHDRHFRSHMPTDALDLPLRGIVLFGSFEDRMLGEYEKLSVPVVAVDMPSEGRGVHSVSVNNVAAARDATERLLALGHRRFAFLRLVKLGVRKVDPDSRERQEGVEAALREAGLPEGALRVVNTISSHSRSSPAVQEIVRDRPRITAVIAASAGRAQLVLDAARAAGRKVPRDLSVVCFQGEVAALPEVSGPRTDFHELGRKAVHLLGEPKNPPQHVHVPAIWVRGRTMGRSRGRSPG
jgi:LacI family repressor for deo operon, udp, cdd, tsx, nupC, and nupG